MKVRKIVKIEIEMKNLSEEIYQAGVASGKTVAKICEEAKISRTYWNRITKNEEVIAHPTLCKLEKVLGVNFGVNFKTVYNNLKVGLYFLDFIYDLIYI